MKFSEACAIAISQAREIGCAFYVHESPSMWDVTAAYQRGWLFKAFPGGRKIVSPAGKRILDSESRPTPREADVAQCPNCGKPFSMHNISCPEYDRPETQRG